MIKRGVRAKVKHLTDKQLRAHLQAEADAAQSMFQSLNRLKLGSNTGPSDNQEWQDMDNMDNEDTHHEEEGDSILDARRLLQDMACTSKRTNADNRAKCAANWKKVLPKMLLQVTGRLLPVCTCHQRKEKNVKIISLTGVYISSQPSP